MGANGMTRRELIDYCLTYPDAYEDYPFDGDSSSPDAWAVMRHRGNKKGFAFIFERGEVLTVNLKCEPMFADLLRNTYPGVTPAYHMNKEHWNSVVPNSAIPPEELCAWIQLSYDLTRPVRGSKNKPAAAT